MEWLLTLLVVSHWIHSSCATTLPLDIKDTLVRYLFNLNIFYEQTRWTCGTRGWKSTASKKRLLPLELNYFIAMQSLAQR